jgi:hypothetical protein
MDQVVNSDQALFVTQIELGCDILTKAITLM